MAQRSRKRTVSGAARSRAISARPFQRIVCKTERHLLFRFNQNVIASIEAGRAFVEGLVER